MKKMRRLFGKPQTASFLLGLIKGISFTYRYRMQRVPPLLDRLEKGERVLLCLWHQQFFPAIVQLKLFSPFGCAVMISRNEDGQIVSNLFVKCGWKPVRGSSSRGGRSAMEAMIAHFGEGGMGAHILDGPTGPFGKAKAGAVKIAQEAGVKMVPVVMVPERTWLVPSWDRFMLPKPFSKVEIRLLEPVEPPARDADPEAFEAVRKALEERMAPYLM